MKLSSFVSLLLLLAPCLMSQDLQTLADNLKLQPLTAHSKQLTIPSVNGAKVRFLGADYEQLINHDGKIIRHPLSDTLVRVNFELSKDGKTAISKDYEILLPGKTKGQANLNPKPQVIPELLTWQGDTGSFNLPKEIRVFGNYDFISELVRELNVMLPAEYSVSQTQSSRNAHIVMMPTAGAQDESYTLSIQKSQVRISSSSAMGAYWGTRTLLQMLVQTPDALPCGTGWDAPRYKIRGFMLDVGRLPIPLNYIEDVVRLMSWYKMNDLQLHLNDNFIFHEHYVDAGEDPFKKSYSAFRLQSDVRGKDGTPLTAQDLFYTKQQFRRLVEFAKVRGVNIVPEIDAPGHALSFTRVRPDLIYQGPMRHHAKRRCEMLDAANPETLNFIYRVWDEYLVGKNCAFEKCSVVHVGSDEFFGAAEDYRRFADGLLKHVLSRRHTPRVWGSLKAKPGKTPVQVQGVQMNLWSKDWASARDSVNAGYDVITTYDRELYVVPFAQYYRADKNRKALYENWTPVRFGEETLPAGHPRLLGAAFAVWNDEIDRIHKGYGAWDIWAPIEGLVNVLAQKMWGLPANPAPFDAHNALVAKVGRIPLCNPLHHRDTAFRMEPGLTPLRLGKGSKGPDYHLTMELEMPQDAVPGEEQVLLDSPMGQLLAAGKDGRIALRRSDTIEFVYNAKLPARKRVKLELVGHMGKTELYIDGVSAGEPENVRFPLRRDNRMSTFVLPLEFLGRSFNGKVYSIEVK